MITGESVLQSPIRSPKKGTKATGQVISKHTKVLSQER